MALGHRDKIMWLILLGALVRREMSWYVLLVIFTNVIIYNLLKFGVCKKWGCS